MQEAGAFAVLMEMVRGGVAARITKELSMPTIGIGAAAEVKEGSFPGPEHTF